MIEWLMDPRNSGVIQALTAVVQALLAIGLFLFTGYSVWLSRQTFRAYRNEVLDATLPVLIFQLWPNASGIEDEMTSTTDLRVLNAGTGAALDIACSWEPDSKVELLPAAPPVAMAAGESFHLTFKWNVFLQMFHNFPGTAPDRKEVARTLMPLGTIRATCRDIHWREVTTVAHMDFLYIGQREPERDEEGWIRVSRDADYAAVTLTDLRFFAPADDVQPTPPEFPAPLSGDGKNGQKSQTVARQLL